MCTVSFLPLPDGGYLLGTNRDESPGRAPAEPPTVRPLAGGRVLMPRDPDAGGTWIAVDDRGRCLCILNGDRPAAPPPEVAPSRGRLLTGLLDAPGIDEVACELAARHAAGALVEKAFKLLVVEPGAGSTPSCAALLEWDGVATPSRRDVCGPAVFTSSSFDPDGVAERRGRAFERLLDGDLRDEEVLRRRQAAWHASHEDDAPTGDTWSVCMHREEASTVSFTAVGVTAARVTMDYRAGSPCRGAPLRTAELRRSD